LNSQTNLFGIGSFSFKLNHLVIIGVLVLAFSMSFLIRSQNMEFGSELNEFDPFFNFRATEYIVENGFSEYFEWHDDKSWYPQGRDVSATSQVMLHSTAAITYQIFGGNSSLYDFTIMFPVIIGSLTVIVIFALVRLFGGTTAGLFASLFFAVSLPILLRGSAGWFKSEPLGLFYGLIGLYLFLSAISSKNKKIAFSKIILGGVVMTLGMASWGGIQFFVLPIGLFILALPFVRKDHNFLLVSIPLFVGSFLLSALMFERPGPGFVFGLGGISLIIPTIFLVFCILVQKISSDKNKTRNGLILLISIIIIGSSLLVISEESNILPLPSFRYLNAVNPFLTTLDPLTDSVAEHATTNIQTSFFLHSFLMIFAGIGIWLLLSKKISQTEFFIKNDMKAFVLIIGITGVYISSAFVRLEVFASISLIILGSIGLSILTKEIFKIEFSGRKKHILKIPYTIIIISIFLIPLTYPVDANWLTYTDIPVTILNGGTGYPASTDWLETLEWIKINTPEDSVIASWWDYGYWITTMSERTTLIDNATLADNHIECLAKILLSTPDEAWNMLEGWEVDYVVVFVAANHFMDDSESGLPLYVLNGGGDESKKQWFMKIAGLDYRKYILADGLTGSNLFWNETLLGKMIPFGPVIYYNEQTGENSLVYKEGMLEITTKDIKFNSESHPLKLVYASSGFTEQKLGPMNSVFVYEVNKNYISTNDDFTNDYSVCD